MTANPTLLGPEAEVPDGRPAQRLGRDAAARRAARHERDLGRSLARPGDVAQGQQQGAGRRDAVAERVLPVRQRTTPRSRRRRPTRTSRTRSATGSTTAASSSLAGSGAVQAAGVVPSMFLGALPASAGLKHGPGEGQGRGRGIGHQQPDGEPRVPERHQLERPPVRRARAEDRSPISARSGSRRRSPVARSPRRSARTAPAPSSSGSGTGARTTRTRTTTSRSCRARRSACAPAGPPVPTRRSRRSGRRPPRCRCRPSAEPRSARSRPS